MSQENVESTTRGRTIEQRIGVRWPGLYHLIGTPIMRLPRGSRLRRALGQCVAFDAKLATARA